MGEVMASERYVFGSGSGSVVEDGAGKNMGSVSCQEGVGESIEKAGRREQYIREFGEGGHCSDFLESSERRRRGESRCC